ncbi:YlcI/YnfO family protein [Candidatus Amarolinea dominans]|uniref:YlcI/YnfO family protein n=2 Tax=Candidatus Amarolinea dominans TaxID=3140696 RepID=UPI0031CC411A
MMSRLTLRLPETLHRQLETLAQTEETSLNQFIVYALTRQVTLAYTIQPLSDRAIAEQKASFTTLLQDLGQASFAEIEQVMAAREKAEPEDGLTPEVIQAITSRIVAQRHEATHKPNQRIRA